MVSMLTKIGPVSKVERLPHGTFAAVCIAILELLREECDNAIDVRLHPRDRAGSPVFGHWLLHEAVFYRAHLAEDIVSGLLSDLETTDGMPFGLFPNSFGIKAGLDQRSTRIVIEVKIVRGHSNDWSVFLVHLMSGGMNGSIVSVPHTPQICPSCSSL